MQMGNARIDGSARCWPTIPCVWTCDPDPLDTPDQPAWVFDTASKGDLNILGLIVHTSAPFRSDFTGQALNLTGQWHWQGNALVHDFGRHCLGGNRILGLISGQVALKGNANGFAAHGPLDSAGLKVGIFDTEFEGAYANHLLWAKHIGVTHHTSEPRNRRRHSSKWSGTVHDSTCGACGLTFVGLWPASLRRSTARRRFHVARHMAVFGSRHRHGAGPGSASHADDDRG